MESSPEASSRPGTKPTPARRPTATPHFQGEQLPWQASPQHKQNARKDLLVAHSGSSARLARLAFFGQDGLYHRPQRIVEERFHASRTITKHVLKRTLTRHGRKLLRHVTIGELPAIPDRRVGEDQASHWRLAWGHWRLAFTARFRATPARSRPLAGPFPCFSRSHQKSGRVALVFATDRGPQTLRKPENGSRRTSLLLNRPGLPPRGQLAPATPAVTHSRLIWRQ